MSTPHGQTSLLMARRTAELLGGQDAPAVAQLAAPVLTAPVRWCVDWIGLFLLRSRCSIGSLK
jgi:hypothetical protein